MSTIETPIAIRLATTEDAHLIWEWDNDIAVREASFDADALSWVEFEKAFAARLKSKRHIVLMAMDAHGVPVGRANLELESSRAIINIALAPEERGKGFAVPLVLAATQFTFVNTPVEVVVGFIKLMTPASIRAFTSAGYSQAGAAVIEDQDALVYEIRRPIG
jgi:RimJ/RimL family protein N-acetyltransferase